ATAQKLAKSVVTVKLVVKLKAGGREEEQKLEVVGTVIDPSGLTIVAASAIDPTIVLKALMGAQMRSMSVDSDVSETNIVLDDGTEVPSDVVLKDPDLDLAFIRPRDASVKFDESVHLKPRGTAPQPLEDVFVLGRMGRLENRATSVSTGAVRASVKGPRTFYILDNEVVAGNIGCIAYDASGAPLGVIVLKVATDAGSDQSGGMNRATSMLMGGGMRDTAIPIMRPVEDILDDAAQAKTAKAPEKKAAVEKKDEGKGGDEDGDGDEMDGGKHEAPHGSTGTAAPGKPGEDK
ncbi:MAG: trypsin-like peptidase domain-containing protein, partial [Polyangiaceae bacterium]